MLGFGFLSAARVRRVVGALAIFAIASGCRTAGCAANVLGDVVGQTGDAYCDRRYGKEPADFCQEIIDTVATSEFKDDCRDKFGATNDDGKCPRGRIIGGCKLSKVNDDGSDVYDWYYDITDIEEAARDAGLDGGGSDAEPPSTPPSSPKPTVFKDPVGTKEGVKKLCADPKRYGEGATFVEP